MKYARSLSAVLAVALIFASCPLLYARKWTDVTGAYSVEADLIQVSGRIVHLKRLDSKVIAIELSMLCVADRNYVAQWQRNSAAAASVAALDGLYLPERSADAAAGRFVLCRDEGQLLTDSEKGLRILDFEFGSEVCVVDRAVRSVRLIGFSGDGSRIVAVNGQRLVCWDAATRRRLSEFEFPSAQKRATALNHDGSCAVTVGEEIVAWDTSSGAERWRIRPEIIAECVTFAPKDAFIAVGDAGGVIHYLDPATGNSRKTIKIDVAVADRRAVYDIAFAIDGSWLVTACEDGTLRQFDSGSGKLQQTYDGHRFQEGVEEDRLPAYCVDVRADGKCLVSGGADHAVRIWDVATGDLHQIIGLPIEHGKLRPVHSVCFSADGNQVAACDGTERLGFWQWTPTEWIGGRRLAGHTGPVHDVAFSPDGGLAASAGWDHTIRLWDTANCEERGALKGHTHAVRSVVFTPSGTRLISGSEDTSVRSWPVRGGRSHVVCKARRQIFDVAVSPDGKRIVYSDNDNYSCVHDLASGKQIARCHHGAIAQSVMFDPQGERVVAVSRGVTIWEAKTGRVLLKFAAPDAEFCRAALHPDAQRVLIGADNCASHLMANGEDRIFYPGGGAVAYSPDGRWIANGGMDGVLRVMNAETTAEVARFHGHGRHVTSVQFSPDGKRLLSGSEDEYAIIWQVPEAPFDRLQIHALRNRRCQGPVAYCPAGDQFAAARGDKNVVLFDAATGASIWETEVSEPIGVLAVDAKQKWILAGSGERRSAGFGFMLDAATGKQHVVLQKHDQRIRDACFTSDGSRVVTCGDDCVARVWDPQTGRLLAEFDDHTSPVVGVDIGPADAKCATASEDQTIRLWELASGRAISVLRGHLAPLQAISFDSVGDVVYSIDSDGQLKIWDTASGTETATWSLPSVQSTKRFSAAGRQLVMGTEYGQILVWDTATGKQLGAIAAHQGEIFNLAFSLDGRWIVVGDGQTALRVRNPFTAGAATAAAKPPAGGAASTKRLFRALQTIESKDGPADCASITPDGKLVCCGYEDGTIRLFDAASGKLEGTISIHPAEPIESLAISRDGRLVAARCCGVKVFSIEDRRRRYEVDQFLMRGASIAFGDDPTWIIVGRAKWDLASGKRVMQFDEIGDRAELLSRRGRELAVGMSNQGGIRIVDATGAVVLSVDADAGTFGVGPDGRRIATSDRRSPTARTWDATNGAAVAVCNGHTQRIRWIGFSPDNRWLATAADDASVVLWDPETGTLLQRLMGHDRPVRSVTFSSDARRIASLCDAGVVVVWERNGAGGGPPAP